jgi:hypothetical protein
LLLGFALILNVNASSAATVNGTSSINPSVKTDLSSSMTNPTNSISASSSKSSANKVLKTSKAVTTVSKAVKTTDNVATTPKAVTTTNTIATTPKAVTTTNTIATTPKAVTTTNTIANTPKAVTSTSTVANTTKAVAVVKDTTKPTVIKTNPVNNKNLYTTPTNKTITLTFNEKIAIKNGWIVLVNSKGVVIPTKISINGNTLTVNPINDLTNSMLYKLIIHSGSIMDLSGNTNVLYDLRFGIQPKPSPIKTDPVNNKNLYTTAPSKTISVTFNEKITLKNGWIVLVNSKGVVIPTKISINGSTLTVNPINDLTNGMLYKLIIHTGSIMDLTGNTNALYDLRFGIQPKVQPAPAIPAALEPYLLPSANSQSTNPQIVALAKSITKGSTSQYTSAVKIFNWVRDNINYSFYYNTQKGALGTLNSRSANCADTSHLMVALMRAAGIPARYEHGNCKFSSGNWYGHVWAQVYVNGKWYYADGTSYRNSLGVIKNWDTSTFTLEGVYRSLPF